MSEEFICPICGAEVPTKAKACPECGSDEQTGWSANTIYDGTDIEHEDDFDYEEWKRREMDLSRPAIGWLWWVVAVVVLLMFVWMIFK